MTPRHRSRGRDGFALAMVVLLLFAIGVAATAAYQVVSTEFVLSTENRQSGTALAVAQAGLQRFIAEHMGTVAGSDSYAIGDGIATVTARRVLAQDAQDYLYYIRSDGQVTDPRTPDSPARRSVATYAWLHTAPLTAKAAMALADTAVTYQYATVIGYDQGSCGGTSGVAGVTAAGPVQKWWTATVMGRPSAQQDSTRAAIIDSTGIRWDILSDPNFPVEFDGSPPNWYTIPSDSFPVVRYVGDLYAGWNWSGQGVLIVTGQLTLGAYFNWDGIILAGSLANVGSTYPTIQGTLVGGLNGSDGKVTVSTGTFEYNSCYVSAADKSLSYLEVVNHTIVELNG